MLASNAENVQKITKKEKWESYEGLLRSSASANLAGDELSCRRSVGRAVRQVRSGNGKGSGADSVALRAEDFGL